MGRWTGDLDNPSPPFPGPARDITLIIWSPTKARQLSDLALSAYWAAQTPTEAKMAGILMDLFAPGMERHA